jgi:hypothetical protein
MKVDAMIYTFNRFECDTRDATLRRDGLVLETEPDVFRLLVYLLEHRDRVEHDRKRLQPQPIRFHMQLQRLPGGNSSGSHGTLGRKLGRAPEHR